MTKGTSRTEDTPASRHSDLAAKIDLLFKTVHPADRGPYSLQEVAEGIERITGEKVSHNTLWKLRTGKSDNPTKRVLEGLAAFFGVNPGYFFHENVGEEVRSQIELLAMLRDTGVRGAQLRTFFELSPAGQELVAEMIIRTARLEQSARGSSGDAER
ncbi:helix-turn-helix transcriptional regulator [Thermomonospora cellulosilytica]|uniref:Transcriptional regulator with XRE-family HTH domain n=1 Tax=Thermomonospora cellulosilytica TaxID=1411118 RepID=A0A7W3MVT9_9ACTN|nr:helix-turn-helix transcriptional regulator [Thermomonospora cellulosilytica]MBA9002832.1 transcriptional regulator with XRE-family HTH domain [Thermomonospora cellulosilytica]